MSISTDTSDYQLWAFTLHRNSKHDYIDTETDFDVMWVHLRVNLCYIEFKVVEQNVTTNGIHYHGAIRVPKKFYRKKLKLTGFNLQLKEITSIDGWKRYCNKYQRINFS